MPAALRSVAAYEVPVSEYVPYSHHVTPAILATSNGEYLSVWKVMGRSHQAASDADLFVWVNELNNMLMGLGESICLWTHIVRRRVHEYPHAHFENPFCRSLDDQYRATFDGVPLMVNELYLTVIHRPVRDKVLSIFARAESISAAEMGARQASAIEAMVMANRQIGGTLAPYGGRLLTIYEHNGYVFSEPAEFLARLLNGYDQRIPVSHDRLRNYIATSRPLFSTWGELGELRWTNGSTLFGMIEIRRYSTTTEPGHLNILLGAPFEFVLSQSFSPLSRHESIERLRRQQRHLIDARDAGQSQAEQLSEAADMIASGKIILGEHHATLLVYGADAHRLRDDLAWATVKMQDVGIIPNNVDLALEAAYWAQLPANWRYRPRPAPITSLNFWSFASLHNFMSGKPNGNPWGPAVTLMKTTAGTPLYFSFHASGKEDATDKRTLGNTAIFGKSGVGKTVLLGFLAAQSQKFEPTIVAFDKDRGMEVVIRAMGGRYLPLKVGEPSGFNPFLMEPTPTNLLFLKTLVTKLVDGISHADQQEVSHAVEAVMLQMDQQDRRLSTLLQLLPNTGPESAHARLLRWCAGGDYGWLFDNDDDSLDLTASRLYGFDLTEFLDYAEIRSPLVMYLLHRTEAMIDGRPFIYLFDEFWKALDDQAFVDLARDKNLTIRKQNGVFVYCTQEPTAALDSTIAKTLVQQCATLICLPNPGADPDDYIDGLKLTPTEFDLVRNLGETSRQFLVKQAGASTVAQLDLSGLDDTLLVLSGTPDRAAVAESLIAEVGDDPAEWLPLYLQRVKE